MKAKVCLGLAAVLIVFLLGGLVMTEIVDAQIQRKTPPTGGANKIFWDYDSGWENMSPGSELILNHHLGGDHNEYFVYVVGRYASGWNIHQSNYGTDEEPSNSHGAEWYSCSSSSITVWRAPQDVNVDQEFRWQQVRVRMLRNH